VVAQRLVDVANIIIGLGNSCERYGLGEQDIAHLETALQPLKSCAKSLQSTCLRLLTHDKEPGGDRGIAQGVRRVRKNQENDTARGHSKEGQTMRRHVIACT
jgi:hypothetical protein